MADRALIEALQNDRLIASIKSPKALDAFLKTDLRTAFLLFGDLSMIGKYVRHLKNHDRRVYIHLDKIQGISPDTEGLKFLHRFADPDGIITTKSQLIQKAKKLNLSTIQRLFMVDSDAFQHGLDSINKGRPDAVEMMPGLIPSMIEKAKTHVDVPIVTGGLFAEYEQMRMALDHGASAVSTGNPDLWNTSRLKMEGSGTQ
ncbi:glycerol-3-phosphate responsive antiterminator [Halobacillus sp. Cin3]|uniref:glycerol-3-phosphate responsive antiterminator n=1 Tax=Halobacillus sp. Cin3 TaxID=2928441 RepID=UPI00248EF6F5|nr:glycerol-3-phosphate responsive antiterminator [Halobacillus sp. Cin3]